MSYIVTNGQEFTDEMIDRWCASYDRGEFPAGEHTVGDVVMGRPPLSMDATATLNVKVPQGMKSTLCKMAAEHGTSLSAYVRGLLADAVLAAS